MPSSRPRGGETFLQRVLIVAAVALCALLAWTWRDVALLAFMSLLIAIGLHGVADPIASRTPLNRATSLGLAGVIVLGAIGGIAWLFGAQINAEIDTIAQRLPEAWRRLRDALVTTELGAAFVSEAEGGRPADFRSAAPSAASAATPSPL